MKYYKHYISKWMDGTEGLSDAAYRAYHVVCQLIYTHDGAITYHERGLAGRCNQSTRLFRSAFAELIKAKKVAIKNNKIYNDKCATELAKITGQPKETTAKPDEADPKDGESAAKDGESSAKAGEPPANPLKPNDATEKAAIYKIRLEEIRLKEKEEEKESSYLSIDEEFDWEFWPIYPHQVERVSARLEYRVARLKHDKAIILDGEKRYINKKPDTMRWLNPSNFLKLERYLDNPNYAVPMVISPKISPVEMAVEKLRKML